ncbi:MAG TPA: SUMF1/EgtB/PvdO family nonheme iron enzyme [Jatrophihabitans sp.]|nr:SUMF1/EgtB/PvdO family nonheme iron enzyme [Jatrophihabitans sp.]
MSEPAELPDFAEVTAEYRLAIHPTTVGQYWHYLLASGRQSAADPRLHGFPAGTGLRIGPGGGIELDERSAALPVTGVSWHGARAYCDWLAEQLGADCRLPTAAEWQHAAAGPDRLRWALGNEFDRARYAPTAAGPRPVQDWPANGFGLCGLTGNVFEWCADPLTMPSGAADPLLGSRVIKGGAYTVRNPESFENSTVFTADELSTVPYIGFRVLSARPG